MEQSDLIRYGLIPEFVGRFPVVSTLQVGWLLRWGCVSGPAAVDQTAAAAAATGAAVAAGAAAIPRFSTLPLAA